MGHLDNEYGWLGDENYPPACVDMLENLDAAYRYGDDETIKVAQEVLATHIYWLEGLLTEALDEAQDMFEEGEDTPFDWIETEFSERR